MSDPDTAAGPTSAVCSAKGCRDAAAFVLAWNNPKLHTPDRRKTWVACEAHVGQLGDFLEARGFLRETRPIADGGPFMAGPDARRS